VPKSIKFFLKIFQDISHFNKLDTTVYPILEKYLISLAPLNQKVGTIFLQMPIDFSPKYWNRVVYFIESCPKKYRLAIALRHTDWFHNSSLANELYALLEMHQIANVLLNIAGRRDLMHMRLTNDEAFIRFVGANYPRD